jgi:hypothetical protein
MRRNMIKDHLTHLISLVFIEGSSNMISKLRDVEFERWSHILLHVIIFSYKNTYGMARVA